ncbi:MAG: hypothetical protein JWQ87_4803 [Candidatus Sulfotelmatobacter sp.]|nr:hypothetical protein [Candidatus Sulfotelmatobacter sp.]
MQISAAWNSGEGPPLGRNQYVELEIKKQKANGASTQLPVNQKPCDKMAEAIAMDGGKARTGRQGLCRSSLPPPPLKKADLLTVVHHVIGQLPYNQVPTLAKRHKVEEGKSTKTPQELLAKRVSTYDEAALCRILLEISLLDSAYMRCGASDELLTDAAKRYRVDVEKLEKAAVAELAAKRSKNAKPKTKGKKSIG